jgi:hypothetical protein
VDFHHPFTGKYMITCHPHKNWQHKIDRIVIPMKSKMSLPLALKYTTPRTFVPSPTPTVPVVDCIAVPPALFHKGVDANHLQTSQLAVKRMGADPVKMMGTDPVPFGDDPAEVHRPDTIDLLYSSSGQPMENLHPQRAVQIVIGLKNVVHELKAVEGLLKLTSFEVRSTTAP